MFGVEETGIDEAKQTIFDIAQRIDNPSAILQEASQAIADDVQTIFDESGPGWPPLKKRVGRPLILSGDLQASIEPRVTGKAEAEIVCGEDYGRFHNFGTHRVPIREFMEIRPQAVDEISRIAAGVVMP